MSKKRKQTTAVPKRRTLAASMGRAVQLTMRNLAENGIITEMLNQHGRGVFFVDIAGALALRRKSPPTTYRELDELLQLQADLDDPDALQDLVDSVSEYDPAHEVVICLALPDQTLRTSVERVKGIDQKPNQSRINPSIR